MRLVTVNPGYNGHQRSLRDLRGVAKLAKARSKAGDIIWV